MHRDARTRLGTLILLGLAACAVARREHDAPAPPRPAAPLPVVPRRPAAVNLSGFWVTGTGTIGEPVARAIVTRPACNHAPSVWILEQRGDSVRLLIIPERHAQGIPSPPLSRAPVAEGVVSGVDVVMLGPGTRFVLRHDSTSGHLRGTLNDAPFWAVRQQIDWPAGCAAIP